MAPDPERAATALNTNLRSAEAWSEYQGPSIIIWCPKAAQIGRLLNLVGEAQATATGAANIYMVTPVPGALQDIGIKDLKFFWKHLALKPKWETLVKDARTTAHPVEMIKGGRNPPTSPMNKSPS